MTRTAKLATSAPGRPRRLAPTLCSWSGRTKRTSASDRFAGQVPDSPRPADLLIQFCGTEEFERLNRHDLPPLLFFPQLTLDHFPPVHHGTVGQQAPDLEIPIELHSPCVVVALVFERLD